MYKSKLFMSVALLFNTVCATSSQIDQNRSCGSSSDSKGLECVQDTLCELTNKINSLQCCEDLCAATVITQAEILTESGIYCLGNDVQGTIVITGSSIILNLNGHIISAGSDGIAVASTASDVRIRNGFIQGSGADRGIFINGATDVRIEDVTCENWENGVYVLDAFSVSMDRVVCNENGVGMLVESSTAVVIRNSTLTDNGVGLFVEEDSVVECINCSASGHFSLDFLRHRDGADQSAIDIANAKNIIRPFIRAEPDQIGFLCGRAATVVYRNCSAFNLSAGFLTENGITNSFNSVAEGSLVGFALIGDKNTLTNCLAENNIEAGFLSSPDQGQVIFRNCVAKGNLGDGFFELSVTTDNAQNMYLNCVSCNNGTNYSANIIAANNAPVTSAANARGFDNIDCSDTTPDLLALVIQLLTPTDLP